MTDPAAIAREALIRVVRQLVLDHDIPPAIVAAEGARLLAESRETP